jgi:hypothetical protein
VLQLEAAFKKRVAQLRVLEAENARLKQKEWALQSCILAFEGSVAATKAVLEANDTDSDAAVAGASDSLFGACNAASYSSGESPSGSMQSGPQGSDVTSCSTAAQVRCYVRRKCRFDTFRIATRYSLCCCQSGDVRTAVTLQQR